MRVAAWWTATRLSLIGFVILAAYLIGFDRDQRLADPGAWIAGRFTWADSFHYLRIADVGYLPPGLPCCDQAFFPGYPLAIRAASVLTGGDLLWAGLLVSLLASAAAAWLLHEVAGRAGDPEVARVAVFYLGIAPYAIILTSVFTEALFLACALAAWHFGRREAWGWAGLFASLATLVRLNGLFVAVALVVMFLLARARGASAATGADRLRPAALIGPGLFALATPLLVAAGYAGYLHARTGSWTAWSQAQVIGWDRRSGWPWESLISGWHAVRSAQTPDLLVARIADLGAVGLGVLALVLLARRRRWPELTYLGLSLAVLICSNSVQSSNRYALTWFPVFVLAAEATVNWGRRHGHSHGWPIAAGLALVCVPLMVALALAQAAHLWIA